MLISTAPSIVTVVLWWLVTPPSFRFVWGALFTVATVPIGWAVWHMTRSSTTTTDGWGRLGRTSFVIVALPIAIVTGLSVALRFDWAEVDTPYVVQPGIDISIAPVIVAPTDKLTLSSGIRIKTPAESDQCWATYPLCSPAPPGSLRLRGSTIAEGFSVAREP